jgi:hypothetical protein
VIGEQAADNDPAGSHGYREQQEPGATVDDVADDLHREAKDEQAEPDEGSCGRHLRV